MSIATGRGVVVAAVVGVGVGARAGVAASVAEGVAEGGGVGVAEALQAIANGNNAAAKPITCRRRNTISDDSLILMSSL
jgi:hypothetical protein